MLQDTLRSQGKEMSTLFLCIALLGTAQAKKGKKTAEPVIAKTIELKVDAPTDAKSKKFLKNLLNTEFENLVPEGDGFVYKKITFKNDNSWSADAVLIVGEEEMDCVESGSWTMDPATSNNTAALTWKITATDCPSREVGGTVRINASINGNNIDAQYR